MKKVLFYNVIETQLYRHKWAYKYTSPQIQFIMAIQH